MVLDKSSYEEKKIRERECYEKKLEHPSFFSRILKNPIIFNWDRIFFNYIFPKEQMADVLRKHFKGKKVGKLLIAPCGTGDDLKYLSEFSSEIYGIDLSPIAINQCPSTIKAKVGDILNSGYADEEFDVIASPLFFHHLLKFGFEPFLKEFNRILKRGGVLIILEPSLYYPVNILTRPLKKIFNNPYGEVEDEDPFDPRLMLSSLKKTGFVDIKIQAASFSHCSFFVPLAKLVNFLSKPLLNVWPFKYFGWMVLYSASKLEK